MHDLSPGKKIDEPLEEDSKIKKIITIIVSIFLLVLLLSYFLLGYPIYPIIASNYESHSLEGNTIFTENFSIVFLNNSYEMLKTHYLENKEVEISVCLKGYKETNYFIEEVYFPEIISQTVNQVIFKSCPEETKIWLHSHPYKRCIASKQDINTLDQQKNKDKDILMIVMCSTSQFNVYG